MQKLYLMGRGISHSVSPAMYHALYASLGLDWCYALADLATEDDARTFLASQDWLSINATTPYKGLALEAASVKAASAQLSGGANMLLRQAGQVVGLNTDGLGCIRSIQREAYSFVDARVVVCGTGPTALSIVAAAAQAGAGRLALVGRDRNRAKAILEAFMQRYQRLAYATVELDPVHPGDRSFRAAYEEPDYVYGSYATSTEELAAADIIIDATPLGMYVDDPLLFDPAVLGAQKLVFDVVYGHGRSALLTAAAHAGCAVLDGCGMVVAQAVENASVLLDAQGISGMPAWDKLFTIMYEAADFA